MRRCRDAPKSPMRDAWPSAHLRQQSIERRLDMKVLEPEAAAQLFFDLGARRFLALHLDDAAAKLGEVVAVFPEVALRCRLAVPRNGGVEIERQRTFERAWPLARAAPAGVVDQRGQSLTDREHVAHQIGRASCR